MVLWLGFFLATSAIVYSGSKLSKYGDIIAEKTGLGRIWIGIVLMASVTSLPELINGISSVTFADVPDIAVGDVVGSCVFNLLIFSLIFLLHPRVQISNQTYPSHVLSGILSIFLLGITALGLLTRKIIPPLGWIGLYSFSISIFYFIAMRLLYFYEKQRNVTIREFPEEQRYKNISTKSAILHYGINAAVVIVAAVFLPKIGEGIARTTGLGQTFVGNILIAISTSLPELVVTFAALKLGVIDLAIGNLFGSNIFNIFIVALDDVLFLKGPLFSFVNSNNLISAVFAIIMTSIAIAGLTYRSGKKPLRIPWEGVALLLCYIINLVLLFMLK